MTRLEKIDAAASGVRDAKRRHDAAIAALDRAKAEEKAAMQVVDRLEDAFQAEVDHLLDPEFDDG